MTQSEFDKQIAALNEQIEAVRDKMKPYFAALSQRYNSVMAARRNTPEAIASRARHANYKLYMRICRSQVRKITPLSYEKRRLQIKFMEQERALRLGVLR